MDTLSPTLVVLAAGQSTRFGRPKQLAAVGPSGEALLDYALYDARRAGFARFVLVVQEEMIPALRDHLAPAIERGLDIGFAVQSPLVPAPPGPRSRPWGTGHAVLAARGHLDGAFAVCNADDFYGRGAFEQLAEALAEGTPSVSGPRVQAFLVSYPLGSTLSGAGGVSRGLCTPGDEGDVQGIVEGLDLRKDPSGVVGVDPEGAPLTVSPRTPVSMNLWGFSVGVLPLLADAFVRFVRSRPGPDAEFYLSRAVDGLIRGGQVRCSLLEAPDQWLGVTYAEDRATVAASLRDLVDSGVYPHELWGAVHPPGDR